MNTSMAKIDENQEKEMKEKGFSKGTITAGKTKECPYILTIEGSKDTLDPMNLDKFSNKGQQFSKVWVKFSSLRMPNRCKEARPVSITAVHERF
ncbi:hypothetical protein [Aquimarina sp. U1-2]|uniref:hypothetical protein n=1 Tax=Aquimarina sp. U1-2 TaxID=2823141 RepID=UPI001AECD4E6|nr:hypothetical protein [Aquimarina sp. U1-2]